MRCEEIRKKINELAPEQYAESWDNSGLLLGRMDKEVKTVVVTLDITEAVIDFAIEKDADMIVSHHPLLFSPVKRITDEDFMGKRIVNLLRHDICCYAMHTNFDSAPGGMGDLVAEQLPFAGWEPLDGVYEIPETGKMAGIGTIGSLKEPMSVKEISQLVKEKFDLSGVMVFSENPEKKITRLAICPGAGKSTIPEAMAKGAEALLTGDVGHHAGIDAVAEGISIIDAGHYGLEHVFVPFMEKWLKENTDAEVISMPATEPIIFF